MKILVPLLTGKENAPNFVDVITNKVDEIILLQIVDKDFHSKTGAAMGEVRQFRMLLDVLKKEIGAKRKKYDELTEWGSTIPKIVSIALIRKVDKVVLVKQNIQFFSDIVKELKKNKIEVDVIEVVTLEEENKKKPSK